LSNEDIMRKKINETKAPSSFMKTWEWIEIL
jgi:hypothetical protein